MSVPKTDALPLGYTPYACPKGKGKAGLEERADRGIT